MPKIVDKEAKKMAIGSAAMRVFKEMGYHRTRMADIALAAGIGKGTIYEYFRDKGEIIRFEFDRYFRAFRDGALEALSRSDAPGTQLASFVEFALSHVETWKVHCAVYMDYFSVARTAEGQEIFSLADIYGTMRELLRGLIERGQAAGEIHLGFDPAATADLLISFYDGVVLHDIFDRHQGTLSGMREEAMRLITRGLLSDDPDLDRPEGNKGRE